MILGLSSYTYGWAIGVPGHAPTCPMNEQDLLDRALRHGVTLVQICDNLPLLRLPPDRLDQFADRANGEGLRLEVGSRGLTVEHATAMIALARRVNANLIRFVVDGPGFHPGPVEVVQTLRAIAPRLDGLRLGIENHDRFTAKSLRSIVERSGSDRIGICLDTANSLGAGEGLATVLKELAPITFNLHIKDFRITRLPHLMGFTVEGCPAGEGMLDILSLLEDLRRHGRCETAVLELWTPPEELLNKTIAKEEEWAGRSVEYLKLRFAESQ
jgi:sugar phosphate isomerase/epimerase